MTQSAPIAGDPRFPGLPGVPGLPPEGPFPPQDVRSRVYDDLLARRTVLLDRALDGETATLVAAQLMALDADGGDDSDEGVTLVVNSPGGPLDAAAAVLDTMDLVRAPLDTTCLGRADGTAAVVAAAGSGRRRIGAGARVRLRLADLELTGPASRLDEDLARHRDLQRALVDRLVAITGQERRLVERDIEAGRTLSAAEAVDYGLADEVIGQTPKLRS
jgi:ATP-dependent Clp protease protease subunit